jgi:hypothetical protein
MPTSKQEEQAERRRVMLEQEGATLHAFAQADAAQPRGRFAEVDATQVVAAQPVPTYPAAATPWQGPDPCGPEPPLNFSVNELESSMVSSSPPVEDQAGDPVSGDPFKGLAVSSPATFERGAGSSTGDPASATPLGVGSPPTKRGR